MKHIPFPIIHHDHHQLQYATHHVLHFSKLSLAYKVREAGKRKGKECLGLRCGLWKEISNRNVETRLNVGLENWRDESSGTKGVVVIS